MPHALVIYNPVSGSKKWKDVPLMIRQTLKKHNFEHTWFETQPVKRQDFGILKSRKFDRIIVVGGDGTVAEVASWMVQGKCKTPLVILAQGSANVLAHSLGIPFLNLKKALEEGLTKPGKPLDAMLVNRKHVALIAVGRGYDTYLMKKTLRAEKRKWGALAYLWSFLKTFLFYRSQPYKITIDGERIYTVSKQILVLNITPAPEVFISGKDGLLNIFTASRFHRVKMWKGKRISIKTKKELTFDCDGEVFKSKTVNIEVLPGALHVVYPGTIFHS